MRPTRPWFVLLALLYIAPNDVAAQGGVVRGRVVAASGEPIGDADVRVVGGAAWAVTGADGAFTVLVERDSVLLAVERLGYMRTEVSVPARGDDVRIVLELAPLWLEGVSVSAPRAPPHARSVTAQTIRRMPMLGEPDVFRALVSLPLVSQPNDLKGRIHLAGGASDESALLLDDHPLQDPTHLLGLFGAVNPWALERADVEIGYLPPAHAGHLSGAIAMTTRRRASDSTHTGTLGLLAASWTSALLLPAGIETLVSGRFTYLDRFADLSGFDVPLIGFHDVVARVGREWRRAGIEVVVYHNRDRFVDNDQDSNEGYEPMRWGETLIGATARTESGPIEWTARASFNAFSSDFRESNGPDADTVALRRSVATLQLEAVAGGAPFVLAIGGGVHSRDHEYGWRAAGLVDDIFAPSIPASFEGRQDATERAAWTEVRIDAAERTDLRVGARVVSVGATWHAEPSMALEWRQRPTLLWEASVARRHQFHAQAQEPIEGSISMPVFLLERPRRADIATLGVDLLRDAVPRARIRMVGFYKRYDDRAALGDGGDFPSFTRREGAAWGVSLSLNTMLPSESALQAAYTFQRAVEEMDGRTTRTPWDAPHALAIVASRPITQHWSIALAYTGRSGRATTPVALRLLEPSLGGRFGPRYVPGVENSIRVPSFHRVDVGLRRAWRRGRFTGEIAVDVINLLNHRNVIDYDWLEYYSALVAGIDTDKGRTGLPIVPTVSAHVSF